MKPPTTEDWVAAEIAERTPIPAPAGITEDAIAEKVALGITRKQAIQVLTAQAEHDATLAAASKKAKAKAKAE
jgi:hypothetical protein